MSLIDTLYVLSSLGVYVALFGVAGMCIMLAIDYVMSERSVGSSMILEAIAGVMAIAAITGGAIFVVSLVFLKALA